MNKTKHSIANPTSPIDFVIITALEEERDAMLSKLRGYRKLDKETDDIYTYYFAEVKSQRKDGSIYQVILVCPLNMGPINATALASTIIKKWNPQFVLLVGIACGIKGEVNYGDVMIATQIADYTLGKQENGVRRIRWEVYPSGPSLLDSANNIDSKWTTKIVEPRPREGSVASVKGVIASGGDVISDDQVVAAYSESWQKLIGIEMESGGIAAGVHKTIERPEFLTIKSVSDFGKDKHDPEVKPWRKYACHTAAAFAFGLLKSGPTKSLLSIQEKKKDIDTEKERREAAERRWEYIQNHPITSIEIRLFLKSSVGYDWFKRVLNDIDISFSEDQRIQTLGNVLKKSCEPNTKEFHSKSEIPICSFWEIYEPEDGYWVKKIKPSSSSFKLVAGFDCRIPWKWMEIPNVVNLQDLASLTDISILLPPTIFQAGVEELIFGINGETYSFSVYFSDQGLEAFQFWAGEIHGTQVQINKGSVDESIPFHFSMAFQGIELLNIFYEQMMPGYSRVSKKEGFFGGLSGPNGIAISFYPSMPISFNKTEESKEYSFTIPGTQEVDFPKIIKEAEKLIKEDEKNTDAYLQLASIFSMQGRFQDVINCLSNAINKATPTLGLYILLGEAFYRLGRYDDALIQFRNAVSLEKNNPDAHFGIAVVSKQIGDFETAITYYQKAILLKPDESRYQLALSQTLGILGRIKEAIPIAKSALKLNPGDTENIILLAGLLHIEGHYDEALELIEKVIKTKPKSAKVNQCYAQILESMGQIEQAITYYKQSLELKKEPDCFFELGRTLCNLERWEESESAINEGLSLDPDHQGLIFVLAVTKANQEKFDDALELLNRVIKLNPDSTEAKELLERINNNLSKS